MNWDLVKWVVGIMLTFGAIKFCWVFLRSLLSRDTMEDAIEAVGANFKNAGDKMGKKLKQKAEERRAKKAEEQNKPVVTIR